MKILITSEYDKNCMAALEERYGEVVYRPWSERGGALSEDELIDLLCELSAGGLITEIEEVSERVIQSVPTLKFIGDCRGNPVNVAVDAANAAGVPVLTTPGRNAEAVAEMFVGSLLAFMRQIVPAVNWVDKGEWTMPAPYAYYKFQGNELMGKTVGFVGMGAVGRRSAELMSAFDCKIIYYDPYVALDIYQKTALEDLFDESDIISVNLPVLDSTRGMINGELLGRMKKEAVFVNTARAAVVDNNALFHVLKEEKIRGAVLDVFECEPPKERDLKLLALPNVLATPHIAGAAEEVVLHHSEMINQQIQELKL